MKEFIRVEIKGADKNGGCRELIDYVNLSDLLNGTVLEYSVVETDYNPKIIDIKSISYRKVEADL